MTLLAFRERFLSEVAKTAMPGGRTLGFYTYCYDALLRFPPLANCALGDINEDLIARYQDYALLPTHLRPVGRATLNRRMATLRKALGLAMSWSLISKIPAVKILKGEREREFVFSRETLAEWLQRAPEPLRSFTILAVECGMCLSEMIQLTWDDIELFPIQDKYGFYGFLKVRKGKTKFRRRTLPITAMMKEVFERQRCSRTTGIVFVRSNGGAVLPQTVSQQARRLRNRLGLPWDACLHAARHTALTNFGTSGVDPFTLQLIAGHSNITTTKRYVHPSLINIQNAFSMRSDNLFRTKPE